MDAFSDWPRQLTVLAFGLCQAIPVPVFTALARRRVPRWRRWAIHVALYGLLFGAGMGMLFGEWAVGAMVGCLVGLCGAAITERVARRFAPRT
ncbi:MAG TPA: hypothetical protein VGR57_00245 [Ktedonobacterales bacterium]|nr:hypothetical protein [Ktedonobacterales bacterium]